MVVNCDSRGKIDFTRVAEPRETSIKHGKATVAEERGVKKARWKGVGDGKTENGTL